MQRKPGPPPQLKTYGFLVGIELDLEDVTTEQISFALSDACTWLEGTGAAQVECLGEIDTYDEPAVEPLPPVQLQDGKSPEWTCQKCGDDLLFCGCHTKANNDKDDDGA